MIKSTSVDKGEVQLMTLYKSKRLEFEVVIHLDLKDWSFSYREMGAFWGD